MAFDWKSLIRTVAPTIGTALGGPLGGSAVAAVAQALLGKPGTEEEVATAMASATPDQLLALKKADQDFAARMKELGIDLVKIEAADRDSARRREVDAHDSWTPRVLALLVTLGFFGTLFYIITHGVATDTSGGAVVLVLVGALGTAWTGICAYYYGSTSASKDKDATLASIAKG